MAFVTTFGAHMVAVNLPVYAKEVGIGALGIGLLISIYDFSEVFAEPLSGWLADRRSKMARPGGGAGRQYGGGGIIQGDRRHAWPADRGRPGRGGGAEGWL